MATGTSGVKVRRKHKPPATTRNPEFHRGGIPPGEVFEVSLSAIRPAPDNDLVYHPTDPNDPGIVEMSKEMLDPAIGQLVPIVVTTDNVILSGHRRYAARKRAKLPTIKAMRFPIASTDEGFQNLLVRFNNQREKDAAELFREELVKLDPVDAHRRLVADREEKARVKVETITIIGTKKRARITAAKEPFLKAITDALLSEREFWPRNDRRVHYLMMNDPPLKHASKPDSAYRNDQASYDSLTELLTRARIAKRIPFAAIADNTRPFETWDVHSGLQPFIRRELKWFLKGFRRDLQRTQPLHIEIVGEKNTILGEIRPIAHEFAIPYTIGRGYASLPPRYDMVQRFKKTGKRKALILFFSDCDPEGDDIPHSYVRSIRDDFGVKNVEAVKVGLTLEQVRARNLPPRMIAKEGSSRKKAFVKRHGQEHCWELDSLSPEDSQQILRDAIVSVLDMDAYRGEVRKEAEEAAELEVITRGIKKFVLTNYSHLIGGDDLDDAEGGAE